MREHAEDYMRRHAKVMAERLREMNERALANQRDEWAIRRAEAEDLPVEVPLIEGPRKS